MESILAFIILVSVFGGTAYYDSKEKERRRKEYLDKAMEYSMKGEYENADMYSRAASRIK